MLCQFTGNTPSVNDVCPHSAYFGPRKTSEHLIQTINNDQIERKSIPALKCSCFWGEMWWLKGRSCRSEEYCEQLVVQREVLEKKPRVLYRSKAHESVSHLIPSSHVLIPNRSWRPLRGWKCWMWQVDPGWSSGTHQAAPPPQQDS